MPSSDEHVKQSELLDLAGGKVKWYSWFDSFLMKLNTYFSYDLAIPLLGIYSREMKTMFTQKPIHKCSWQLYS